MVAATISITLYLSLAYGSSNYIFVSVYSTTLLIPVVILIYSYCNSPKYHDKLLFNFEFKYSAIIGGITLVLLTINQVLVNVYKTGIEQVIFHITASFVSYFGYGCIAILSTYFITLKITKQGIYTAKYM